MASRSFVSLVLIALTALAAKRTDAAPTVSKIADTCFDSHLGDLSGVAYFLKGSDVWATDGTIAGTKFLTTGRLVHPKYSSWHYYPMAGMGTVASKGAVLYGALQTDDIGVGSSPGWAAWFLSPAGVIDRSAAITISANVTLGGRTLLLATNGMYETDGTLAGTKLVTSWYSTLTDAGTNPWFVVNVYDDGTKAVLRVVSTDYTVDYFVTDGTATGTKRLTTASISTKAIYQYYKQLLTGASIGNYLYLPDSESHKKLVKVDLGAPQWAETVVVDFTAQGGILQVMPTGMARFGYLDGNYQTGVSDGTSAGTVAFAQNLYRTTRIGNKLAMLSNSATARDLYVSDLTPAGTTKLLTGAKTKDDAGVAYGVDTAWLASIGGKSYFTFDDGTHGHEIWSTDGTASGTSLALEMLPGSGSTSAHIYPPFGGTVLMDAKTSSTACALYTMSDSTWGPLDAGVPDASIDASAPQDAATDAQSAKDGSSSPIDATTAADASAQVDASQASAEGDAPGNSGCAVGSAASAGSSFAGLISLVVAFLGRRKQHQGSPRRR